MSRPRPSTCMLPGCASFAYLLYVIKRSTFAASNRRFQFLSNHVKCERDCLNNNLFNNPTHSSCRNHAFAVPSHHLVFHIGRFVHHGSDQPASSSTNSQKLHDIMKSSNSFAIGVVLLLLLGHEANCSSILIKASLLHFQIIAITNLKKTNENLAVQHNSLYCSAHTKP